ncbi:uncharacterized protein [Syngnathus scovelli]|uniref:uncharacterized protein isoform X1 n=1 Tax=Syngnathus scovelli TaxID=161590 RepID=UPI0035C946EC
MPSALPSTRPSPTWRERTHVRLLFVDFSSAFNTIVPQRLICKLDELGLSTSLCNWILDFLCQRPQVVRVGDKISASITLSTGAPQGCVLSPLFFTLLTHDCTATYSDNRIVKFADDTLVGLITKGDETRYRSEVDLLTTWCRDNNLLLNVNKTKEIIVDFRKGHTTHLPLIIDGAVVERVSCTKFLGVHISEDLLIRKHLVTGKESSAPPVLPAEAQACMCSSGSPVYILPWHH